MLKALMLLIVCLLLPASAIAQERAAPRDYPSPSCRFSDAKMRQACTVNSGEVCRSHGKASSKCRQAEQICERCVTALSACKIKNIDAKLTCYGCHDAYHACVKKME